MKGAADARHLPARPLDRARLRRLPPHRHRASSNTRAAPSPRWKRSCAPRRNRSADDRDADRADDSALDGKGRYRVRTGIRFLDHMLELFARHGGVRPADRRATGDLDVDQHHTVEDLGIALGEAVSKALGNRRGINRAGYFVMPMDETLAVAAIDLGGRPHAVVDLKVTRRARRRSADRAGPRFLRGLRASARAPTCTSRCCTADRAITRSKRCSRRSRARCASPARRTSGWRACCRAPRACCDRAHRLQGRQPDVGAQGARRDRRRRCSTPAAPERSRARPAAIIVPGVGHFGATARARRAWVEAILRAASATAGRCSASASACSGCSKAARKRRTARASACSPGTCYRLSGRRPAADRLRRGIKVPHVGWNSLAIERDDVDRRRRRRPARRCTSRTATSRPSPATPSPPPSTASRSRRSSSAATSPACSSTRRNPATSGCRSSATSLDAWHED